MSTTSEILRGLGYSEEQALREFALLHASQKHAELTLEDTYFQKKYGETFSDFAAVVQSSAEEEFEGEDDYLAWKFAVEGAQYWKTQLETLRRAP